MSDLTVEYRPMEEADVAQIHQIEVECFSDPWSEDSIRRELNENAKMAHYMVAVCEGKVVGYGGFWQIFDEAHIMNIAVSSSYRRNGIAQGLIDSLEALYKTYGIMSSTLEVRVSNEPALALYEKNGYYSAGIRKNYYEKPREDACIMWKQIQG